jgi:rRNA maturation RNase YbeY
MLTVTVIDPKSAPYKTRAVKTARWLMQELKRTGYDLEIFIVGDAQMPKNVLAFPAENSFPRPDLKQPPLGEIYLNPKYITEHDEDFEYMLIHGFLHLLGYDHIKKSDRMVMEPEEQNLLRRFKKNSTQSKR